jgi:hypothetical protein
MIDDNGGCHSPVDVHLKGSEPSGQEQILSKQCNELTDTLEKHGVEAHADASSTLLKLGGRPTCGHKRKRIDHPPLGVIVRRPHKCHDGETEPTGGSLAEKKIVGTNSATGPTDLEHAKPEVTLNLECEVDGAAARRAIIGGHGHRHRKPYVQIPPEKESGTRATDLEPTKPDVLNSDSEVDGAARQKCEGNGAARRAVILGHRHRKPCIVIPAAAKDSAPLTRVPRNCACSAGEWTPDKDRTASFRAGATYVSAVEECKARMKASDGGGAAGSGWGVRPKRESARMARMAMLAARSQDSDDSPASDDEDRKAIAWRPPPGSGDGRLPAPSSSDSDSDFSPRRADKRPRKKQRRRPPIAHAQQQSTSFISAVVPLSSRSGALSSFPISRSAMARNGASNVSVVVPAKRLGCSLAADAPGRATAHGLAITLVRLASGWRASAAHTN